MQEREGLGVGLAFVVSASKRERQLSPRLRSSGLWEKSNLNSREDCRESLGQQGDQTSQS